MNLYRSIRHRLFALLLLAPLWGTAQAITLDKRHLPANAQIDTITVAGQQQPLLIQLSHTPIARGVALLIGDPEQHPLNRRAVFGMADTLNQYGWITFNIAPYPVVTEDEGNEPDPQTAPKDSSEPGIPVLENQRRQLDAWLVALAPVIARHPGMLLAVTQGPSAAALTQILEQGNPLGIDAMVALGPYLPDSELNRALARALASTDVPLLDIYTDADNAWVLSGARAREIAAAQQPKKHYRQRQLPPGIHNMSAYVGKEIYGWTTHLGW